jgi:hypothetical protein
MRRFTATNVLTVTTMLAGAATGAAAAIGWPQVQGITLGTAVVVGALLLRFIARDLNEAGQRHDKTLSTVSRELGLSSKKLDAISEQLAAEKSRFNERIETLYKRIEQDNSKSTLRILSDINAARLEQIDAIHMGSGNDSQINC